jgi:Prokaryotic phospholipase A2
MTTGRGRWLRWAATGVLATALGLGLVLVDPATPAAASPQPVAAASGLRIAGHGLGELLRSPAPGRAPLVVGWQQFHAVMGYTPAEAHLAGDPAIRAIKPTGACSSPLGSTRFGFGLACKAHDLGYDLLRFATRTSHPAAPGVRQALDDQLARDLHARCDGVPGGQARLTCDALADLYAGGARLNSWRQHYGTP